MTDTTITATITARGPDTTVPDRADAIDADVLIGGEYLCAVTLIEDRGTLGTWGDPDMWCDDWRAVVAFVEEHEIDTDDLVGEIVAAVQVRADLVEADG